jgi:RND family efflux transporter MFP subunit
VLLSPVLIHSPFIVTVARAQTDAPSPVTLVTVMSETLREQVNLSGSSIPWRRTLLSPRVEGLATEVLVDQGSWVKPGDIILKLDARLADIEVDIAKARVDAAAARQRDALRKRDELMRLKQSRHASETEIESAIVAVETASADLNRERAELERFQELRARHSVFAPFAGMVVSKQVEAGQWIEQNDAIVELVEMDTLRIRAPLPQRYYSRVTVGARAHVRFDALPEREFEGQVFARVALGNASSRSFPVLIDIPNKDHLLAPGMSARLQVELDQGGEEVLTLPRDAVITKVDGSRQVWRVQNEDGLLKVFPIQIETGRAQGDRLEVWGGALQAGDRIVLLGNENLRPGQTVAPQAADAATASTN